MAASSSTVFVGRQKELKQLLDSLYNKKKSIIILSSESGMGKSALLSRLYGELKETKAGSSSSSFLVGFYDKDKALVGGSDSLIQPFVIALKSLLQWLEDTSGFSDEVKNVLDRALGALITTLREEGSDILVALIDDVAKKFGLQQTVKFAKKFYENFRKGKTVITLAEQYVAENQPEAINSYLTVIGSLANKFPESLCLYLISLKR